MIKYDENKNIWVLETNNTAYAFGVSDTNTLNHIYYGDKLPYISDYPHAINLPYHPFTHVEGLSSEEYMSWCKAKYSDPCLKATFNDYVRDVVLEYKDYYIEDNTLTVRMADTYYPFTVSLKYAVIEDCDLIIKKTIFENNGDSPITLETALTGSLYPPRAREYRLSYVAGKWAGEFQLERVKLPDAKVVLESRRGTTSHTSNPFFMLDENGAATEDTGKVYFGALAFSGNWKMVVEKDCYNKVKVNAGINDFDFAWNLKPDESFEAPEFVIGYTGKGFGQASRNLHKYQLNYVLPKENRHELRKILYNSWEATFFDVDEKGQCQLADIAADIGVELFVMDDGWFGQRNSDKAGLGDWQVNSEKFPNGLKGLIDYVNHLGMDFGLWVEPEMVNPDSDLYRAHPDWIYHYKTRYRTEIRDQYVLNLARPDVREFIYDFMFKLLSENNIKFIKWDMNRNFSEPGYPTAPVEEQREIWVRHVHGIYSIVEKLKSSFLDVIFQTCSGGGGRIDLGIFKYFDQAWTSDNTDAFDRLKIQEGFSYAYSPKLMESWVTSEVSQITGRKLPLKYRFHSSMMGNLGIGDNLLHWNEDERNQAKELIRTYKGIRPIIQHGELYRLISPHDSNLTAVIYVDEEKSNAVAFIFLHSNHFGDVLPNVRLQGLKEDTIYTISGYEQPMSGKALMSIGILPQLKGDFDSEVLIIKALK